MNIVQSIPVYPTPSFPYYNTLHEYGTLVTINEPVLNIVIPKSPSFIQISLVFSCCLFPAQDPIQETTLCLVIVSPLPPLGCDSFSDFPCF